MRLLLFIAIAFLNINISTAQVAATADEVCPIKIGATIPNLEMKDAFGEKVNLQELTSEKQTVFIFYRGGWCPYCNAHLSDIAKAEDDIIKSGYQIVAISPDNPENLNVTVDKKELKYTLLSDADGNLMKAMGIAFKVKERKWKSNQLQKYFGGLNDGMLPVPSIFIVNKKGEIVFKYVNPKYSHRMSSELLLTILNNL